jgi:hypothetical protein
MLRGSTVGSTVGLTAGLTAGLTIVGLGVLGIDPAGAVPFVYGCGTGCRVEGELVSEVTMVGGYRHGRFRIKATGLPREPKVVEKTNEVFADCDGKRLGFGAKQKPPAKNSTDWLQIEGTRQDYTTVSGGRGFYFEALCQATIKPATPKLTEASQVGTNGLGPVLVGMTVAEAEQVAGRRFDTDQEGPAGTACLYSKPQGLPGVGFMVIDGKIARIDVWSNPKIKTFWGAKIGDSEARIKQLYGNQIEVQQHEYRPQGHYLVFVPKDKADKNFRVVFETDGQKVTQFRSGRVPEVEYVEGCA